MNSRMSHHSQQTFISSDYFHESNNSFAWVTTLAYGVLSAIFVYYILQQLNYYPLLPAPELVWNCLVYLMPPSLVSALDQRTSAAVIGKIGSAENYSDSRTFAAKSQAMRHILGLDGTGMLANFRRGRRLSGINTAMKSPPMESLPGLGNWDNSCYQNSVIQGLAALTSLDDFLAKVALGASPSNEPVTTLALKDMTRKLNDPANAGQKFWTPTKLKTMSSWQQQDAQEYYSKILDEVDKESSRSTKRKSLTTGLLELRSLMLKSVRDGGRSKDVTNMAENRLMNTEATQCSFDMLPGQLAPTVLQNPLEGLLAQRVGCLTCGFVEGLSLIPFNCLTVPLGKQWQYDIRDCLDDYTVLETISGVECSKCTLLRQKQLLQRLLQVSPGENDKPRLSEALHLSACSRLNAVLDALENEDFSESTISKKCQIPAKGRVETDKSKQAIIARLPQALAVHVNRSVFNERTGMLSKNHAQVTFPKTLDLSPWYLGQTISSQKDDISTERWNVDPSLSMLSDDSVEEGDESLRDSNNEFILRAVITHYGRHENGHYICYRRTPADSREGGSWWRLSDDEVSEVSEDDVLDQGGVFMLFYERIQSRGSKLVVEVKDLPDVGIMSIAEPPTHFLKDASQMPVEDQGSDQRHSEPPTAQADEEFLHANSAVDSPQPQPVPGHIPIPSYPSSSDHSLQDAFVHDHHGVKNIEPEGYTEDEVETRLLQVADPNANEHRNTSLQLRTAGVRKIEYPGNVMPFVSSMITAN